MLGLFGASAPGRLGVAGHLLGLLVVAVMLGAIAPRADKPASSLQPNAWDYEFLSEGSCDQVVARLVAFARQTGSPAWIWVDESTPDAHANAIATAARAEAATLDGVHLVAASRVTQPVAARPVPGAFATDELDGMPETPCRFSLNGVHSVPKAAAPR